MASGDFNLRFETRLSQEARFLKSEPNISYR